MSAKQEAAGFQPRQSVTDLTVKTPYGMGVYQLARFMDHDGYRYLVRLPVNDETRSHLGEKHCLTPKGKTTCLFSFTAEELGLEEK